MKQPTLKEFMIKKDRIKMVQYPQLIHCSVTIDSRYYEHKYVFYTYKQCLKLFKKYIRGNK